MNIWHNTRGKADQYFVVIGDRVLFQIPKWLGKVISGRPQKNSIESEICHGSKDAT